MKKILKSIVILAAALSVAPMLSAQNITEPYRIDNGIAFKKSVSPKPDPTTGEYTVKIETFVTGEVATRMKAIPSDIVLVLDMSGSMTPDVVDEDAYISTTREWEASDIDEADFDIYYYRNNYTARAVYTYNGEICYNYYNQRITLSTGGKFTGTLVWAKVDALKQAVRGFIDQVSENDATLELQTGETGNQIAIVQFSGDPVDGIEESTGRGATRVIKRFTPVAGNGATTLRTAVDAMEARGATGVDYGLDKAQALLIDLATRSQNPLPAYDSDGNQLRSKTVVVFTDGEPTHGSNFDNTVARDAVNKAKTIKATEGDNACFAKVFTIGVFTATGNTKARIDNYMEHMSSNYPDGSATIRGNNIEYSGTRVTPEKDCIYYQDASNNDLSAIFAMVADQSKGQSTSVGDESLLTLDIVSSSFSVPEGADLSKVKISTAQCLGELNETYTDERGQVHKYLAFAAPVEAKNRAAVAHLWCRRLKTDEHGVDPGQEGYVETYEWYDKAAAAGGLDIDENITKVIDETTNSVSTKGFNFSDYWCGFDENDAARENPNTLQYDKDTETYYKPGFRGFKLILEFPITFNDDAVGGPSVKTNEPGSGIYLTDEEGHKVGEPLVTFNQPQVETPVNLWVKKYGLNKGESATFGIYRRPVSGTNTAWEETPFTTIVITGTGEMEGTRLVSPVYKMNGLSPQYYYKVIEQGWSWSYDQVASEDDTATSTETLLVNPVRITDQKRDTNVKHAESKAINIFGNGYETKTIDSREFLKPSSSNDNGSSTEGGSN